MSAVGTPSVAAVVPKMAAKAIRLWRPMPVGPRKRAATTEIVSEKNCGRSLLAVAHNPAVTTLAPVVSLAGSNTPPGAGGLGGLSAIVAPGIERCARRGVN